MLPLDVMDEGTPSKSKYQLIRELYKMRDPHHVQRSPADLVEVELQGLPTSPKGQPQKSDNAKS